MKIYNLRTLSLAAMAGVALSSSQAMADPYADGDLILGFRASSGTGGTTNFLINLGSADVLRDTATQITLNLGNLDADLDTIFGSDWATRPDFLWSISGTQFAAGNDFTTNRNLIASRAQNFPLGPIGISNSTPWNKATLSTQGAPALKMQALGNQFGLGTSINQTESTNVPLGLIQSHSANNSLEEFMSGGSQSSAGSSFAYFSGGIEGNFGLGAPGTALDIYFMTPGTGPGIYEGTFTIGDNAQLTFTPEGVPEPSSALMLALGASALGFIRRRQRA